MTYKHNFVTKSKKPISHYFHGSAFLKALADIEVPAEWIEIEKHSKIQEMYQKEVDDSKIESPVKKNKKQVSLQLLRADNICI